MQKKVNIQSNNHKLSGILIYPKNLKEKNPAILFIHGWMSNKSGYVKRAKTLAKLGYICLVFDLYGHGESAGKLSDVTAEISLENAISAYDYLASLPNVDKGKISIVGSSYGGYLSSMLSEKRNIFSLVLRVPAIYENEAFNLPKVNVKIYKKNHTSSQENYALKALSIYKNSVLLIESENDEQVPHETIGNYRKALNKNSNLEYILMRNADHSLTSERLKKEFITILVNWFKKQNEN